VVEAPNSGLRPISKAAVRESSGSAGASIATEVDSSNGGDATSPRASAAPASAATEQASGAAIVAATGGAATAAALAESKATSTAAVAGDSDAADPATEPSASALAGASGAASLSSAATARSQAAASVISPANAAALSLAASIDKHPHAGADSSLGSNITADAAAGLSQLSLNSPVSGSTEVAPTPTLQVHASVDSADFSQGLSDRVSWMVNNGVNSAKLQVNPPQLGPIELNILVQGDHAQVSMITHSAVTRDALESSSPQLREMLGAQGFGQVSVDISHRSFQDRSAYTPTYERASASDRASAATPAAATAAAATPRSALGALDAYA
jgi:flagellar hook-length control protein FliK